MLRKSSVAQVQLLKGESSSLEDKVPRLLERSWRRWSISPSSSRMPRCEEIKTESLSAGRDSPRSQ